MIMAEAFFFSSIVMIGYLWMKRTDGVMIRVSDPVRESLEKTLLTQTEFGHQFYLLLGDYTPR